MTLSTSSPNARNRLITQLKQRFSSEILWHFTGRAQVKDNDAAFKVLISILETGLKRSDIKSEFIYFEPKINNMETLAGYPVCCLADIPLKDLHVHAERYGITALGFHKTKVIENHFIPVMYVNQYSAAFRRFVELRDKIEAHIDQNAQEIFPELSEMLYLLGSFVKSGDLKANPIADANWDNLQVNNFYYEREWRSIYDWDFKSEDLAVIILPDEKIAEFSSERKNRSLRLSEQTVVLPFSMVYRF